MMEVSVSGQLFSQELYQFFLTSFKESFSYSSLSIESAFEELKNCDILFRELSNEKSCEYYEMLEDVEKKEVDDFLKYVIVCRGHQFGILPGPFDVHSSQEEIKKVFQEHFSYMLQDMHFALSFNSNGELDKKNTFMNTLNLFQLSFEKENAKNRAYNMQKDHMDAFDYAMSLEKIGVLEIISINEIINQSDSNREIGFKKTDNIIMGAPFSVTDKEKVPFEMQKLLRDYENNFGLEILDYTDSMISSSEKYRRILTIFEKEALFHIRFERIHPFQDGNGRTGRILMNKHLIDAGFAPVLITSYMTEEYKKYVANYDYQGLAKIMLSSSSQLLSNWVSIRKMQISLQENLSSNETLAIFSDEAIQKRKK